MTKKRLLQRCLLVAFAVMLLCLTALSAGAATDSGRCGSKLYWSFDSDTGTLAFTGTGAMFSYATQDAPWLAYRDQIRTVSFESGITTISERAFYSCRALQTVSIPATVTTVGASAFEGCEVLTDIAIPNGIAEIGAGAFSGCTGARRIEIPSSVTSIGTGAFKGCTALETITVTQGNTTYRAAGNCLIDSAGVLVAGCANSAIPNDGSVTAIAPDAFQGFTELSQITIPNSVKTVGEYAFQGCTGLSSVSVGTGLTSIGTGAFQGCSSIAQLTLPDTLTEIGAVAFSGCSALTQVNFPQSLASLGSWAFANTGITQVSLSNTVSKIGINPFRDCDSLTSITVNYRNRIYKALGNCLIGSSEKVLISGCATSQIPANYVVTVGREAFRGIDLKSLTIPDTVTAIEADAFTDSDLESIYLGAGIAKIDGNPLADCKALTAITVSEANPVYTASGNCLLAGTTLVAGCKASEIPQSVQTIGYEAFRGSALTELTLPEGVQTVSKRAFFRCEELQKATLPSSLSFVAESAFELSGLTYLALGPLPEIDSYAFLGCFGLKTVYTPDAAALTPGSAEKGYIAYYADYLTNVNPVAVKYYKGTALQGEYRSLADALEQYEGGWLQLNTDLRVSVTLPGNLYIDMNGHDLTGTVNTSGYTVYGMDTTTDKYNGDNVGIFACTEADGSPVIPQRQVYSNTTGATKRYLAIQEETGYTFHRFYIGLTHVTVNMKHSGLGYKGAFYGDEKVISQLDPQEAFGFRLQLNGFKSVSRSLAAEKVVSGETVALRVDNYQIEEHGETPLSAWIYVKLSDGTVIQTATRTVTMRKMVEDINKLAASYSAAKLQNLLAMLEPFPVTKTWNIENILAAVQ